MVLKFVPKVSYYANFYFFVQNLSEWHISNRKKHNEEWRSELSFSDEADICIREFRIIHNKYPFGDKYLGRPFFLNNDPWTTIGTLVEKDDFIKLKKVFSTLEPYFKIIYQKDEVILKKWATIITKPDFTENASNINNTLANFYGCEPYNENCTIFLLLSTKEKNGGTANSINNKSVTLELSRTTPDIKNEKLARNILWHELIHLYFRNFLFYLLLEKSTNKNLALMSKIDELVASALLPCGLLKGDFLPEFQSLINKKDFNSRINSEKIIKIQKLIYPYLQERKTLDMKLIQDLLIIANLNN